MRPPPISCLAAVLLAATCAVYSTEKITAADAKNHIGKNAIVCGRVASANYAVRSKGQPTFINLDEPYPRQIFTAVIWGSDRSKFGQPEAELKDKRICVTGLIEQYHGTPEMVLRERSQLKVEN